MKRMPLKRFNKWNRLKPFKRKTSVAKQYQGNITELVQQKTNRLPGGKSIRQKLIEVCDTLLRKILFAKRGTRCEICGRDKGVGLFHILPKGTYPRLRFCEKNLLLVCWLPCHASFHHDLYKAQKIEQKIKALRGVNYRDKLLKLNAMAERHTMIYLNLKKESLKQEAEKLEKGQNE